MGWTIEELKKWNDKIEQIAGGFGLDYFPQEFEICDHHDMIGFQTYTGMPSRYSHWSYGKMFEKQQTLYKLKLSGLAYEMVINTNPCLAYLMVDNPLSVQILTIAHVYGHNDFFKNNRLFQHTRPELVLEMFKRHADRVNDYIENPAIGAEKVERILDACHALRYNISRTNVPELSEKEQKKKFYESLHHEPDEWSHLAPDKKMEGALFQRDPYNDVLLFIRDNNPFLEEWEKDLISIVHAETRYFLPQMETKIMNEGWASFWHYNILKKLELESDLHIDFLRSHNQVICPHPGGLNPYHIGFRIFEELSKTGKEGAINSQIFEVRKIDRDASFLQRFLTKDLAKELNLFEYQHSEKDIKVSQTVQSDFEQVKATLIKGVGVNGIPLIKVKGFDSNSRKLELLHLYDGRELELKHMEHTLKHVYSLWNSGVSLQTKTDEKDMLYEYNGKRIKAKPLD